MAAKKPNTELQQAIIERERRALSATWRSGYSTSPSTIADRRLTSTDESLAPSTGVSRYKPIGMRGAISGALYGGAMRRTHRDGIPPRSVVTNLVHPVPEPNRPMPGDPVQKIHEWNLRVIAEESAILSSNQKA